MMLDSGHGSKEIFTAQVVDNGPIDPLDSDPLEYFKGRIAEDQNGSLPSTPDDIMLSEPPPFTCSGRVQWQSI